MSFTTRLVVILESLDLYAHSVGSLDTLRSIAREGIRVGTSIEKADKEVFAVDPIKIIFRGPVAGRKMARSFAPDLPFLSTREIVHPSRIVRIEVNTADLLPPPLSLDELGDKFAMLEKKFGGEVPHNHPFWRELERTDSLNEVDDFMNSGNWESRVKETIAGTPAASAIVIERPQ